MKEETPATPRSTVRVSLKVAATLDAGALKWISVLLVIAATIAPAPAQAGPVPYGPQDIACQAAATAATTGYSLDARFWRSNADTIVAASGESAVIAGSLASSGGLPLANATLCVSEWLIGAGPDAKDRVRVPRVGLTRTDAGGSFVYRLPAGPNREAIVAYGDGISGAAYALRYFAPANPTLRAAPRRVENRGRPVRFRGRLPGPHARGRVVVLQAFDRRGRWLTFRQTTTDRRGRFRAEYRFRATFEPYTYYFRALTPRQAGYPWLPGTSAPVSVRVTP